MAVPSPWYAFPQAPVNRWLSVESTEGGVTRVRALPLASVTFAPGEELALELRAARERVLGDPSTRAVVLTLTPGAVVESADASLLSGIPTREAGSAAASRLGAELDAWADLAIPVVAALDGSVDGLAAALALVASARIASPGARLAVSSVDHGLVPAPGTTARLVQTLGRALASEVILCSRELGPGALKEAGFVEAVSDDCVRVAARSAVEAGRRSRSASAPLGLEVSPLWARVARLRDGATPEPPERARAAELARGIVARAGRGADARRLEIEALGELGVSSITRRIAAHRAAPRRPSSPLAVAAADRMRLSATLEAITLASSVGIEPVDRAARAFGFARALAASVETAGHDVLARRAAELARTHGPRFAHPRVDLPGRRPRRPVLEELQQRIALAFVNEAFHALDEELDDEALDAAAIAHGGFPAYRGGPIAFARSIGLAEVHARLDHFARELGARFEPARALARRARDH